MTTPYSWRVRVPFFGDIYWELFDADRTLVGKFWNFGDLKEVARILAVREYEKERERVREICRDELAAAKRGKK